MLSMFMALIDSAEQQTKFEKIYYAYRKQMISVAQKVLKDNGLAEDAVQEAFISIAKQIECIQDDNENRMRAYVLTVTKYTAIYIRKKEWKNQSQNIPYETIKDFAVPNAEDSIAEVEAANDLEKVIRQLPVIYQDVLLMKLVHELDYDEIATALHRTESTVRRQATRAKKMLAELYVKEGLYVCV